MQCELLLCPGAMVPPHPASLAGLGSGLASHTAKTFKKSGREVPVTTWKNTQNVEPTKLALKL